MTNDFFRNKPRYNDDSDFTTNSESYYKDLARKQKLIQLLAEKIWKYENTLKESLESIEQRLTDYITENDQVLADMLQKWDDRIANLDKEVSHIFVEWLEDGTLEQIINHEVLGNKADKTYVDELNENVTAQLEQNVEQITKTVKRTSGKINVKEYGVVGDGSTNDTTNLRKAFQYAIDNNLTVILNAEDKYFLNEKLNFNNITELTVEGNNAEFIFSSIDDERVGLLKFEGLSTLFSEIEIKNIRVTNNIGTLINSNEGELFNLEVKGFKKAIIENVNSQKAYKVGIQLSNIFGGCIKNCSVFNTRYAGIRVQGCENFNITENHVEEVYLSDGISSVGYGIALSTSGVYSYGTFGNNKNVTITKNKVYNVGRKNIDVHNGINVLIEGNICYNKIDINNNKVYGHIYATNEGGDKIVKNITIKGNILENEVDTVADNSSGAGIKVGSAFSTQSIGQIIIEGNTLKNIHRYNIINIMSVGIVDSCTINGNTIISTSDRFSIRGVYIKGSTFINHLVITNNSFNLNTGEVFSIKDVKNLITHGNILENKGQEGLASIYTLENITKFKRADLTSISGSTVLDKFVNVTEDV